MLPSPTINFTIPSIHDDLILQCRVYHPRAFDPASPSGIVDWRKKCAIVAHPYAPLGGCMDDPVVDIVASTILKQGFIVGTFNFRGAGTSKGRTSWQSKAEQNDYISFIGFMVYYLNDLCQLTTSETNLNSPAAHPQLNNLSPIKSQAIMPEWHPRLLLAGYSYGALITTCLPPMLSSIIAPFQTPQPGSSYAEIRLRASSLATQQNVLIKSHFQSHLASPTRGRRHPMDDFTLHSPKTRKSNGGVRIGGEEDLRRASHDSYRSRSSFTIDTPERVRRSVDRLRHMSNRGPSIRSDSRGSMGLTNKGNGSNDSIEKAPQQPTVDEKSKIQGIPGIVANLQVAYLLVSPLQGLIGTLATMGSTGLSRQKVALTEYEMKLTIDPTLALYGDDDVFVSVRKLRTWVERLEGGSKSGQHCSFRRKEIPGAGHFWHDHEAIKTLQEEVKDFVGTL